MPVPQNLPDTAEVFDHFSALTSIASEAGGVLLFYGELDRCGMATAVAANIAGAVSLGVDRDGDRAKTAVRLGFGDFTVNSLDEALRILKNQLRKKEPVAVTLVGDPETIVSEMLERGVQPDLVACSGSQCEGFIGRGAKVVPAATVSPCSLVVTWSVSQDAALWLSRVDTVAVDALKSEDDPRVKWLRLAPRYLRKNLSRERYVRMQAEELTRFVELLQQRMQSGEIAVPVQVSSGGQPVTHSSAAV